MLFRSPQSALPEVRSQQLWRNSPGKKIHSLTPAGQWLMPWWLLLRINSVVVNERNYNGITSELPIRHWLRVWHRIHPTTSNSKGCYLQRRQSPFDRLFLFVRSLFGWRVHSISYRLVLFYQKGSNLCR